VNEGWWRVGQGVVEGWYGWVVEVVDSYAVAESRECVRVAYRVRLVHLPDSADCEVESNVARLYCLRMASARTSSPNINGDSPNLKEFEISSPSPGDRDALSSPSARYMPELKHRDTNTLSPRSCSHSPPETVLEAEGGQIRNRRFRSNFTFGQEDGG